MAVGSGKVAGVENRLVNPSLPSLGVPEEGEHGV